MYRLAHSYHDNSLQLSGEISVYIYVYIPFHVEPYLVSFPTPPTPLKLKHKSLSEQQEQSFSILCSWHSLYPKTATFQTFFHLLLSNRWRNFQANMIGKLFLSLFLPSSTLILTWDKAELSSDVDWKKEKPYSVHVSSHAILKKKNKNSRHIHFNNCFIYILHYPWLIHMLYASSAASMSGSRCVLSYHITALWQVSHTSQVGF